MIFEVETCWRKLEWEGLTTSALQAAGQAWVTGNTSTSAQLRKIDMTGSDMDGNVEICHLLGQVPVSIRRRAPERRVVGPAGARHARLGRFYSIFPPPSSSLLFR